MTQSHLDKVARDWLEARGVIAGYLLEAGLQRQGSADEYAAGIIARLANHNPPILLTMDEPDDTEVFDANQLD